MASSSASTAVEWEKVDSDEMLWTDRLRDHSGLRGAIWFSQQDKKFRGGILINGEVTVYEADDKEDLRTLLASVAIMTNG